MHLIGFSARRLANSIHLTAYIRVPVDLLPATVLVRIQYCLN